MIAYKQQLKEWLQRLHLLQAANVQLKTDLAHWLQSVIGPSLLEEAEQLQTQLINEDMAISLLRHELSVHITLSSEELHQCNAHSPLRQQQVETGIYAMEQGINRLRQRLDSTLTPV